MVLRGGGRPEEKKVSWNCAASHYRSSSNRVLVEASPPEYPPGADVDQDDSDASYMAELLADTQPADLPTTHSQPKASQHLIHHGDFGDVSPLLLDTSLELGDNRFVPLGPQTQAAQDSLERNGPMAFASCSRSNIDLSTGLTFGLPLRPNLNPDISSLKGSENNFHRRSSQLRSGEPSFASDRPHPSNQEACLDAPEASTDPSLSEEFHSSARFAAPSPALARLDISLDMSNPVQIHFKGRPRSPISPHPPPQPKPADCRPSEDSLFLAIEGEELGSNGAHTTIAPLQSTCFNNASLTSPDITRGLALAASQTCDDILDSSSYLVRHGSNVDLSLGNTPDQKARVLSNPSDFSHASQRPEKLFYSPNAQSTPNSPTPPSRLAASPMHNHRSSPGLTNIFSSSLEDLDPLALPKKLVSVAGSAGLQLLDFERLTSRSPEGGGNFGNLLSSQDSLRQTKGAGILQQPPLTKEHPASHLNVNQGCSSHESRELNTSQQISASDQDTGESTNHNPLPHINRCIISSRDCISTQSCASSLQTNVRIESSMADVNRDTIALLGTSRDSSSYEAPPTLIIQPSTSSKALEKPATLSDSTSYEAPPTQIIQPLAGRTATKRDAGDRLDAPSVGPSRMSGVPAFAPTRRADKPSQPIQESSSGSRPISDSSSHSSAPFRPPDSASELGHEPDSSSIPSRPPGRKKQKRIPEDVGTSLESPEVLPSDSEDLSRSGPLRTRSSTSISGRNPKPKQKPTNPRTQSLTVNHSRTAAPPTTRARSKSGQKATVANLTQASNLPPAANLASDMIFPIQRVLAYCQAYQAFLPAEVISMKPDQVVVRHDKRDECIYSLESLRRCEIVEGDLVRYIGSEVGPEESQLTAIRDAMRVLKVTRADNNEMEAPGTLARDDDVWTDLLPNPFKVEGLVVQPDQPKKPFLALSDRKLSEEVVFAFRQLMKSSSGVGMRTKSAPASARGTITRTQSAIAQSSQIFDNFKVLVTDLTENLKVEYENTVSSHGGTVIKDINKIYRIQTGEHPQTPRKAKQKAFFDCEETNLCPVLTHCDLKTILLVAQGPLRTTKYLMALALGIPCVSTHWVTHSCEKNYAVDWTPYLIGSGSSAFIGGSHVIGLQSRLLNRTSHDLNSIFQSRSETQIFKAKKFLCMISKGKVGDERFEKMRPILCALGVKKIEKLNFEDKEKIAGKEFDYVLFEDGVDVSFFMGSDKVALTLSSEVGHLPRGRKITKASSHDTSNKAAGDFLQVGHQSNEHLDHRVVDFEWVRQCLIFGELLKARRWAGEVSTCKNKA